MLNIKAAQQQQVILAFGFLVQPFMELAALDNPPQVSEYNIAIAKVLAGEKEWSRQVQEFCTFADDIFFEEQYKPLSRHVFTCSRRLSSKKINCYDWENRLPVLHEDFKELIEYLPKEFLSLVNKIPVDWEPEIFSANTPFTSYLKIKDVLAVINQRFQYFDRYLKPDFFDLFLRGVDRKIAIRLVTTANGVKAVNAVALLASQEFTDFQLIEVAGSTMHDRNLRIDDRVFTLGPGVDRAGIALSNFAPGDSTPGGHKALDRIISDGKIVI